jgi:RecB family exonuclease
VVHEKDQGQIAFTRELALTEWFAKDVYGRVVWDLALVGEHHAVIIDYKTGKKKDDPFQLQIFAAVGFIKYPTLRSVETRYVWTNGSPTTSKSYSREDVPWMWNEILPRVERIETAVQRGQYDPRPSGLCRWCPVRECEHNAKEK